MTKTWENRRMWSGYGYDELFKALKEAIAYYTKGDEVVSVDDLRVARELHLVMHDPTMFRKDYETVVLFNEKNTHIVRRIRSLVRKTSASANQLKFDMRVVLRYSSTI